ncbi:ATP-grasp domain-containing protein [Aureimonas fodinaquatilis]|uniref:ATP-grasp domain-containing protein n=1 Tax=Aureimonas fodinaquatilis TaxID=2565783 RepID=A0A5B0DQ76_9HYPH|nr:ATP-grasp domain-containing protein [Aureimonas fodinaquatilis]KAA0968618.1 ATP-grasp domain-containing protein [Aureimonas fodinaquatilis]
MTRPSVLIAAFSARQIARSAQLAGYDALAVDFFNDLDLGQYCAVSALLTGHYPDGFDAQALLDTLEKLALGREPLGFVYGAGFEDRPDLLDAIGQRWPILGNCANTVRQLKDPAAFALLCRQAGIAHPPTALAPPRPATGWLAKKMGGSGGSHIVPAETVKDANGYYFQPILPGEKISLGLIGMGRHISPLGLTRQWNQPIAEAPYRYGGALGPLNLPQENELVAAVAAIAQSMPLLGLCSADFLITEGQPPVLLEINPRAGATLDVFENAEYPLFQRHMAAFHGKGTAFPAPIGPRRASGLLWAEQPIIVPQNFMWPEWAADLPRPGAGIASGEPVCTIVAEATGADCDERQLYQLFTERQVTLLAALQRSAA